MPKRSSKSKSKILGFSIAAIIHGAIFVALLTAGHKESNEFEEMIPIAMTTEEPEPPTGEMVTQEIEEMPEPEKAILPEPEEDEKTKDLREKIEIIKEVPKKPDPPKKEEKKKEEPKKEEVKKEEPPKKEESKKPDPPKKEEAPKKPTLADRLAAAKAEGIHKDNTPRPVQPTKTVSGSDLYKPQAGSGKAAIKGSVSTDGISSDQASAQQLYFSVINSEISRRWNRLGPNELGVIPSPVVIMFNVSSNGMVNSFRIVSRSSSAAMNAAAENLGNELKTNRFKSYAETGIKGLGSAPMKDIRMELRYVNQ